jgi:acetyl esterase/lipase
MKKHFITMSFVLATFFTNLFAQKPTVIPLYTGAIPNSKPAENLEKTTTRPGGIAFTTDISVPTIKIFLPKIPNGQAIVICPGGGYWGTADDHEGDQVAQQLNALGVTAFVLKYRMPDERFCVDKTVAPLQDAQAAIRLVRKNAAKYKINPHKIGIMGFSAGGHLAATAATHFSFAANPEDQDTTSARPDFAVLGYPVISFQDGVAHVGSRERLIGKNDAPAQRQFFSNELQVTPQTPPSFLVHAGDDNVVPVNNSILFYQALVKNGVDAEMHLYPHGGHGFGLNNSTIKDKWMERLANWLKGLK